MASDVKESNENNDDVLPDVFEVSMGVSEEEELVDSKAEESAEFND